MNRKLLKLHGFDYAYFVDGVCIAKGPYVGVRAAMERDGLTDIDFAVQMMEEHKNDVADFGIFGGLTFTTNFEETNLGCEPVMEV